MATTATITPTLGSAPVTLQAGNYSAIDDRRFWSSGVQEGVLNGGSYQVIQRAAGANMTVDVASSVGLGAVVQGDSVTGQGAYFVPQTAANVNVDIAAADATNPRNDLVVLEVKDDQHDAGGLNIARVRVITGTANASAAATDAPGANGTPALPSSCFLLALVRVTAAASSVTTAMINDRRTWAGGVPQRVTSLPSPAVDGQEVYYQSTTAGTGGGTTDTMSTVGAYFHLRYRNAFNGGNATFPWEAVGTNVITDEQVGTATTTGTAYTTALASGTAGPRITVPLRGDYIVTIGCNSYNNTNAGGAYMSYSIGATGAVDGDSIQNYAATTATVSQSMQSTRKKLDIASGSELLSRYRVLTGTGTYEKRLMCIQPVRVV